MKLNIERAILWVALALALPSFVIIKKTFTLKPNYTTPNTESLQKRQESYLRLLNTDHFTDKELKQYQFICEHLEVALQEENTYHVPAAVKLAQAVLESGAGTGTLYRKHNNVFCIKAKRKKERYGQEGKITHSDDKPTDKFVKYRSRWASWRDHSKLLHNKRYRYIFTTCQNDPHCWAKELKNAGYATNPNYDRELIQIIDKFKLQNL